MKFRYLTAKGWSNAIEWFSPTKTQQRSRVSCAQKEWRIAAYIKDWRKMNPLVNSHQDQEFFVRPWEGFLSWVHLLLFQLVGVSVEPFGAVCLHRERWFVCLFFPALLLLPILRWAIWGLHSCHLDCEKWQKSQSWRGRCWVSVLIILFWNKALESGLANLFIHPSKLGKRLQVVNALMRLVGTGGSDGKASVCLARSLGEMHFLREWGYL